MKADPGNITYGAQIHMISLYCQDRYSRAAVITTMPSIFKNVTVIIEAQLRIMTNRKVIYVCWLK